MAFPAVFRSNWKLPTLSFAFVRIIAFHCSVDVDRLANPSGSSVEKWRCAEEVLGRRRKEFKWQQCRGYASSSGIGNVSLWRGKKKMMGREGLAVVQQLKRFQNDQQRLEMVMKTHVSRLLKSDLLAVLAEFQRQDHVFLALKIYNVVRKEIWYKPDKFFFRDMLMTLARNKKRDEAMQVWKDMKQEEIRLDQHIFADIVRAFLDNELPSEAMYIYEEMRQSLDPPMELPYRVILKGLLPYPQLRDKVKQDFLELFPDIHINEPPEEIFN